jgi:NAD-dependent deacetylase
MSRHALAKALVEGKGLVLVVTGAGISLASGIPTFRGSDKNAIWKRDVTELATLRYFHDEPAGSWRWYLSRFDAARDARPNQAHHALAELERFCDRRRRPFLLVTQNIDTLHAQAGSQALVEVHGSSAKVRCAKDGCAYGAPRGTLARDQIDLARFRANPIDDEVPRCPRCQSFLRQHVLWFDEYYTSHESYEWPRVLAAAETASLVLFVGTSFSVGVTDLVVNRGRERRRPMFSVDPSGAAPSDVSPIVEPAESSLVTLMADLA